MNKTITVIGPNRFECSEELYNFGIKLGKLLIDLNYIIINGGMQGIMEATFKGAKESKKYSFGKTIGIIPSSDNQDANEYCDIIIPTGIGYARNQIVVNSSDTIIAIGGGAGTLSEIAFAWQLNKKIYAFTNFNGWAKELANIKLDNRYDNKIIGIRDLNHLKEILR
jgi:uncharacterized protein (TIGR00725 family)